MSPMLSSRERTGVIVVRIWCEPDHPEGLRARVTMVRDVESDEADTLVVGTVDGAVDAARRFVTGFAEDCRASPGA